MGLLHETIRLLRAYGIKPRKRLGQSFCIDADLMRRLIRYADVNVDDIILEVGAGFGFLTEMISESAGRVVAVEVDPRLVEALKERLGDRENVMIVEGDVLEVPLPNFSKVVSNPPYSISSPLLFRLLERPFEAAVMTLQREFAERLVAPVGSRDYGRLTVMAHFRADIEMIEHVSERAFYPSPKVGSTVVRIKPHRPPFKVVNEGFFSDLVQGLFSQRNKKVRNALLSFVQRKLDVNRVEARELIADLPFIESRAYRLSPEELGLLSNEIHRRFVESRRLTYDDHVFYVFPEVYPPSDDTYVVTEHLETEEGLVLDMGTGCGILAILTGEKAEKVVAVDINPHAVNCAKLNVRLNKLTGKVDVRQGDLFEAVGPSEKFDLIIFNPPYLPVEEGGRGWIERSWSGGATGRAVIERFLGEAPRHLSEKGRILMVQSSLSEVEETIKYLERVGLKAEVVAEKRFEFERIFLIRTSFKD
ncbi:MAG: 16S rRNA (adenine(1518)-N(6)/adenine(1519)-N(6))-dimethyltransferase RsmA [Candidatus Bathyarchaeia archaeon]